MWEGVRRRAPPAPSRERKAQKREARALRCGGWGTGEQGQKSGRLLAARQVFPGVCKCYSPLESAFSKNLSSWPGLFRRRPCELSREPLAFKGGSLRVSSRSRDSAPLPPLVAGLFGSLPHGRRRKRPGQSDPPGQVFWNRSSLWGLKPGILVLEPVFCVDISVL